MAKLLSEDAEILLQELLDANNVKTFLDDKLRSFESNKAADGHLRELIAELVNHHLVMCTWFGETIHEAKVPLSAEQYFEEKEQARLVEEARLAEEARLEEEALLLEEAKQQLKAQKQEEARKKEEAKKQKESTKKEAKLREESKLREQARLEEIVKLQEQAKRADESRQREINRLQEEARRAEGIRQKEITRLEEQIKQAEEARKKEEFRLKEEARLQEEARLHEQEARLREEASLKEEARLKEAADLYAEAGIQDTPGAVYNAAPGELTYEAIKAQIAAHGGNDKQLLGELLDEVSEIMEEIGSTRRIPKRKRFYSEISKTLQSHGWFYSAVISLIGKSSLDLLGE